MKLTEKRLRDFRHSDRNSPYQGTCYFCACYYIPRSLCLVDQEWTPAMGRCALAGTRPLLTWWNLSGHERAELVRVKIPSYESGLSYFHHLTLNDKDEI